jgi:hypothetical protein
VVFQWFKQLKDKREDIQDAPRSRRILTSRNADTVADVCEMVTWDRRWALRMMTDELNISKETILQILHEDLRKRKNCTMFVTHRLNG